MGGGAAVASSPVLVPVPVAVLPAVSVAEIAAVIVPSWNPLRSTVNEPFVLTVWVTFALSPLALLSPVKVTVAVASPSRPTTRSDDHTAELPSPWQLTGRLVL